MISRLLVGVWLVVLWIALWDDLTWANVISGSVLAAALLTIIPIRPAARTTHVRPLAFVKLAGYFAYQLIEANVIVALEVITPGSRINQGIVEVPVRGADDVLLTSLGNAISLTPGTLTLEVRKDPPTLWIHVLHLRSLEETRQSVLTLERLMLEAVAPDLAERLRKAEQEGAGR